MHKWRRVLKPLIDEAVNDMKAEGHLPRVVADALNDFGRYCQHKGDEIALERERQGGPRKPGSKT